MCVIVKTVATDNFPVGFNFIRDDFNYDECANEISHFVERHFPDIAEDIKRVDILEETKAYVGDRKAAGAVSKDGIIEIEFKRILLSKKLGFMEVLHKQMKQEQDNYLYHEFQHIKNRKQHELLHRQLCSGNFVDDLIDHFVQEYLAYYESNKVFPLFNLICIDEFQGLAKSENIKIALKSNNDIQPYAYSLIYNYAAALAYKNAMNELGRYAEIKFVEPMTYYIRIESAINSYLKNSKNIECVEIFLQEMRSVLGLIIDYLCSFLIYKRRR